MHRNYCLTDILPCGRILQVLGSAFMAVVAFVRPEPSRTSDLEGLPGCSELGEAESRLRLYGCAMKFCFVFVLVSWVILEIACLLSLFLHFRSGIVVGTINGSLAFKAWPPIDYFSPNHPLSDAFVQHIFPTGVEVAFSCLFVVASIPFCTSLFDLVQLFNFYSQGKVFTQGTVVVMRRIGHCIMATGYSPLLLGPIAHAIGVLRPISGITDGMIAFFILRLILLAISHVIEIGQRMRQDLEEIL